jgi:hypothetical protein
MQVQAIRWIRTQDPALGEVECSVCMRSRGRSSWQLRYLVLRKL